MFDRAIEIYNTLTAKPTAGKTSLFSFGDPEPILASNAMDYLGTFMDMGGEYYRPPVSLPGLVSLMGANAYHGPILHFKKNMILKWFVSSKFLSTNDLEIAALNHLVTGNSYFQRLENRFRKTTKLQSLPAIPMRRARKKDHYIKLTEDGSKIEFKEGEVIHLLEPDLKQSIYGVPEYMGGIQSVLLGESSTLFRRKVLMNGNHMGYILVTTDADIGDEDAKTIGEQIKLSKGPGNGRSMYLNIGKSSSREPVKVIPIGDIGTKDDFEAIKNITEREMLAMHRMQPGLSGIIPQNTGGFGDMEKTMRVYHELEVVAMQQTFLELNEIVGEEVVKFQDPEWKTTG
ncbi:MAG: phage portal protein [Methylobacter sp.]